MTWHKLKLLMDSKRLYPSHLSVNFPCAKAILDGECLGLAADIFVEEAVKLRHTPYAPQAVGGIEINGGLIVAAMIQRAFRDGVSLKGTVVRNIQKKYGAANRIENAPPIGTEIVIVHDVISIDQNRQIDTVCKAFMTAGYDIAGIMGLMGSEFWEKILMQRYDCPVKAIFYVEDYARENNV